LIGTQAETQASADPLQHDSTQSQMPIRLAAP
jgi:hypothetical protein